MIQLKFGERLKELRQSKLISQYEFAKLLGIDRAQISKIEKGKINVTLETIEKISIALGVKMSDLMMLESISRAKPFVKWAGGKTQILLKLKEFLPNSYNTYFEPFLGGGALFFSLSPNKAILNDQNSELICAYQCFKDRKLTYLLKKELKGHEENHSEAYFYQIRSLDQSADFLNTPIHVRAARMIYLNKACFNGLYRVNSKGYFNVPFGKKIKVNTFDEDNFDAISDYFSSHEIHFFNQDYQETVANAKKGDFVYFDPPYDVYPNKSGFVDYGKDGFGKEEQIRLRNCAIDLTKKGVKVMLSNHNTPLINELYNSFTIHVIDAKRMINSNAEGRGFVQEVIVTNY
jgi:DNA adenine methylase